MSLVWEQKLKHLSPGPDMTSHLTMKKPNPPQRKTATDKSRSTEGRLWGESAVKLQTSTHM